MARRNKILVPEARNGLDALKASVVKSENPEDAKFEAAELACVNQDNLLYFNQDNLSCRLVNSTCSETVLLSSITIYDNEEIIRTLSKIINYHDI